MTKEQRQNNGVTNSAETTGHLHAKKKEREISLDTDLTLLTKINSECITDLNVKCRTIKLLEDNIAENLDDLGYGDEFLGKHHRHYS